MNIILRDRLFFLIVFFTIFTQIPKALQLIFVGSFMENELSLYPIIFGMLCSIYYFYKRKNDFNFSIYDKIFLIYGALYISILLFSLLHGLIVYPYYKDILDGPANQIRKLPLVQHIFAGIGFHIETRILLKTLIIVHFIKAFILNCFWYLFIPYLLFNWYKNDFNKGFSIFCKSITCAVVLVCLYGIIDFSYLSGSHLAEGILHTLNPLVHQVKSNGTWWPPLFWKGQLRSLFAEPSYYGIYAAFSMPILWYQFVKKNILGRKILLGFLLSAFIFGLFLTKSRTANAIFFGELFLLILFSLWLKEKRFFKNLGAIILIVITMFFSALYSLNLMPGSPSGGHMGYQGEGISKASSYVKDNIGSIATKNKRSNRARLSILEASISIGKIYPILGVGSDLRSAYIPSNLSKAGLDDFEVKGWIHNQKKDGIIRSEFPALGEYCTRFAETGILGLLIFLIPPSFLAFCLLRRIYFAAEEQEKERCIFFFISLSGIMASGLGDNLEVTCCYWILVGMGYALIISPYRKNI